MNFLENIWNWLNGNKTTIGLVLQWLLAQVFFKDLVPEGTFIFQFVQWLSGLLIGGGVLHKFVKATTAPGPNT